MMNRWILVWWAVLAGGLLACETSPTMDGNDGGTTADANASVAVDAALPVDGGGGDQGPPEVAPNPMVDEEYLPHELMWIGWDAPRIVHSGIDVEYAMTGYDWFDRELSWSVVEGPEGMTIDGDGTLHWVPPSGSTTVDVELELSIGRGADRLRRSFVIEVDDSRCLFVAPDGEGDDTGAGSLEEPLASVAEAFSRVAELADADHGATVYLRGGTHTTESWPFSGEVGQAPRVLAETDFSLESPLTFRSHPGERARHVLGRGFSVWRFYRSGVILYGFEAEGGGDSESALVRLTGRSVAKHLELHGFDWSRLNNPTGLMLGGGAIVDRCLAYDNYDREAPEHHNSANYLFYGTAGDSDEGLDTFIIDSVSRGYSSVGFKIKHAGRGSRLHVHRSVSHGTVTAFGGAADFSSVRHSFLVSDNERMGAPLTIGVTDPTTRGEDDNRRGMLVDECVVVLASDVHHVDAPRTMSTWRSYCTETPEYPLIVRRSAFFNLGAEHLVWSQYDEPDEVYALWLEDNRFSGEAGDRFATLGRGQFFTLAEVEKAGLGAGNTLGLEAEELVLEGAGSRWSYRDGAVVRD